MCDVLMGILLSTYTGIPLASPQLEHSGYHGGYPGAEDLFKLDPTLFPTSTRACPRPEQNGGKIPITPPHNVMPPGEPNDRDIPEQDCAAMEAFSAGLDKLYRGPHSAHPSQTALDHQKQLKYDPNKFNVAVHFRHGDITPTPKEYYPKLLANVLSEFEDLLGPPESAHRLPVVVWIFSEDPAVLVADLEQLPEARAGSVEVRGDTSQIPMLLTFSHWLAADVWISCDSSIAWPASYLAGDGTAPGMPVAIAPPSTRQHPEFRTFAEGNIVANIEGEFQDARAPTERCTTKCIEKDSEINDYICLADDFEAMVSESIRRTRIKVAPSTLEKMVDQLRVKVRVGNDVEYKSDALDARIRDVFKQDFACFDYADEEMAATNKQQAKVSKAESDRKLLFLVLYCAFLLAYSITAIAGRSQGSLEPYTVFEMQKRLTTQITGIPDTPHNTSLYEILTVKDFYSYLTSTFHNAIYTSSTFDGDPRFNGGGRDGFINGQMMLLGGIRISQGRTAKYDCMTKAPEGLFSHLYTNSEEQEHVAEEGTLEDGEEPESEDEVGDILDEELLVTDDEQSAITWDSGFFCYQSDVESKKPYANSTMLCDDEDFDWTDPPAQCTGKYLGPYIYDPPENEQVQASILATLGYELSPPGFSVTIPNRNGTLAAHLYATMYHSKFIDLQTRYVYVDM
ncbi:hypothetical protein TeGR_g15227, partial [Tetraparma gracilis]